MKTIMILEQLTTLDAIKQFLEGTQTACNKAAEQLNSARDHLFKQLHERLKIRA
jgi:hypothetical protein